MNLRVAVRFVRPFAKAADTMTKSSRSILPLVSIAGIVAAMLFGGAFSTAFAAASLTPLGDLPGGDFVSDARGVSGDGSVVVGLSSSEDSQNSPLGYEAFRWTAGGGMVGLGDLPGGDFFSQARGISADGSTVVGHSSSAADAGNYDEEAFRWTAASGMVGLGDLPGGDFYSDAWDVSADGSTVVGVSMSTGNSFTGLQAFRWTSAGGMEPLWDLLLAGGIDPAANGWTQLNWAYGVSANGNTIVGYGIRNGNVEAFVAVVPEPGGLSLIGLAVPALLRRRKRVNNTSVKWKKLAGEADRQRGSSPARQLPRRSVCALTGDDFLIISQTQRKDHEKHSISWRDHEKHSSTVVSLPPGRVDCDRNAVGLDDTGGGHVPMGRRRRCR